MNRKQRLSVVGIVVAMIALSPASAQQATERFIPIGESPGASGTYSYIGRIVAVNESDHVITVETDSGRHEIRLQASTQIWLDRSKRRRQNTTGTFEDCEVGRRVEVMHLHDDTRTAAWIKIESR